MAPAGKLEEAGRGYAWRRGVGFGGVQAGQDEAGGRRSEEIQD